MFLITVIHIPLFYRNMWPLAAICCLGLVGFLIAATIVLALIPVYLPSKDVTVKNNNNNNNNTVSGTSLFVDQHIIFYIDILHDV